MDSLRLVSECRFTTLSLSAITQRKETGVRLLILEILDLKTLKGSLSNSFSILTSFGANRTIDELV